MDRVVRFAALFLLVPGIAPAAYAQAAPAQLRAGAATANITPWLGLSLNGGMADRKTTFVHDELHARAIVLDDGTTPLAIVVADSCMIPRKIHDEAKEIIRERTGIATERVLMAATHSHSCGTATGVFQSDPDPEYQRFLTRRLAEAVVRATVNLRPARAGWGAGKVPQHVFNRRWKLRPGAMPLHPFGKRDDKVKMNPSRGSPDLVEPAGPIDADVWVLSLQGTDGRPLALLANYSLHYVGGTGSGHVSADYFGMFAGRIQELLNADRLDPPFVGILSNGTSGDINNINFREPGTRKKPYEQMRLVANDVAAETLKVYRTIEHRDSFVLDVRQTTIKLGVRRPSEADVARAHKILASAKGPNLSGYEQIYARETLLLSRYPEDVEIILQTVRIGNLAICAIPCEVFVEIGLDLKRRSPFASTFTIELANGYNGYLPTVKQQGLGGYETWRARSSYLEVDAAPKIVAQIMRLLAELHEGNGEPGRRARPPFSRVRRRSPP